MHRRIVKDIFTTVYTVKTDKGVLLFDAASFDTDLDAYIQPMLDELKITAEDLKYIFISHNHGDHSGGLRPIIERANELAQATGEPAMAIELPNGDIVTGKTTELMGCSAAALLNALKQLTNCGGHGVHLIAQSAIEPIQTLKVKYLGSENPRLHSDEILIALASSASADERAARAMGALALLKGCQAHCTVILAPNDADTYKRLGIQLTCEPQYQTNKLYHK